MAKQVPIEELELDTRCQARVGLLHEAIAEYAAEYEAGRDLPPIDVFDVDGTLYVVDGFHRIPAALEAGKAFVRVNVVGSGDIDAAIWHATGVNQTHGVRRSNEDKRRAVRMAIRSQVGQEQSSRAIAEHCGVGHPFVSKLRKEWETKGGVAAPARRKGRDGKRYCDQVESDSTSPPNPAESLGADSQKPAESPDFPADEFDAEPAKEREPMPSYGATLSMLEADIRKVRATVSRKCKHPALHSRVESVRDHLSKAAALLKYAVPVECKRCSGAGCDRCGHKAWLERGQVGR